MFGTDGTQNATHGSDSPVSAAREIGFFFPSLLEWTFAIIKPDAVKAGKAEEVKGRITGAGFTIVAQQEQQVCTCTYLMGGRGVLPLPAAWMVEACMRGP